MERTLRNKKLNHLFSVTSYSKQGLSTAAARIPCICWRLAIQGWLHFRTHPLCRAGKLAYWFCGPIPAASLYVPSLAILGAHSTLQGVPHKIPFITIKLSAESWLLQPPSFFHSLGLTWRCGTWRQLAESGWLTSGTPLNAALRWRRQVGQGVKLTAGSWRKLHQTQKSEDKSALLKWPLKSQEIDITVQSNRWGKTSHRRL